MRNPVCFPISILNCSLRRKSIDLAIVCTLIFVTAIFSQAQTFTVLYNFSNRLDGANPIAGVTIGGPGSLYGTTNGGGANGRGTVYHLGLRGSSWQLTPLFEFNDALLESYSGVVFGPNGILYGTTTQGGSGKGTVYELRPSATPCKSTRCYWSEKTLYSFRGGANDGEYPAYGTPIFDRLGNIYGMTQEGGSGSGSAGIAFKLTQSGGEWTLSILHSFSEAGGDGYGPQGGLIFDAAGNLYGMTSEGGAGFGTAFELKSSGGAWTENLLYNFNEGSSGEHPQGSTLIMDQAGSLYGTTYSGGTGHNGTVFEMTPSNGSWTFSVLYSFTACNPETGVTMDAAGNLYGNCPRGGTHNLGMVYKLTHAGGSWIFVDLHDFTGGSDGSNPYGTVALDGNGNLYGTAYLGGQLGCGLDGLSGCGTVWGITP